MLSLSGSRVDKHNDRNQARTGRGFAGLLVRTAGGASAAASIDCVGVLPSDPVRRSAVASGVKTVILLIFLSALAATIGPRFPLSLQATDFPDFYCAARMLAEGHGHQLYDAGVQRECQAHYAARVGTLYIHPPFEAVLYLAVAWLPLRHAYWLWSVISVAFLGLAARRLTKEALFPWDWRLLLVVWLTFVPLLLCLVQGQDSILLLLLVTLACAALRHGRAFAAGCWLGLGLFKFQLVVPLALLIVLIYGKESRARLAEGFGLVALALAGLSAAICGWSVFTIYPQFLLHLQAQTFAGIIPEAMANVRGLTYLFFHSDQSLWAIAAVSILSVGALVKTLTYWRHVRLTAYRGPTATRQDEFDRAFAYAVLFALLVSYHLNPHDLSLLLLPISVLLHQTLAGARRQLNRSGWMALGLLGVLFLPPLHVWALRADAYALVALPVLLLFLTSGPLIARASSSSSTAE
jgi:glycosyl transferase family 87